MKISTLRIWLLSTLSMCTIALILCLIALPSMYLEMRQIYGDVMMSVEDFKMNTDKAWVDLMLVQQEFTLKHDGILINPFVRISRSKRAPKAHAAKTLGEHCNCGVIPTCPPGPPGPPGLPGEDGFPGIS
uniref:Col_cuticle_N domain-containing protein n=2 Tax=Bursaphelenchus xylophilus TaxID=6326 RepID=A0A1I7SIU5_BURXY